MRSMYINKYNLLLAFTVLICAVILGLSINQIIQYQNPEKAISGQFDGRRIVLDDEYLKIFNSNDIVFTEDKKAERAFEKDITKRWFNFYEKDGLKNGLEIFFYMDSSSKNNKEIQNEITTYLGLKGIESQELLGCNEEKFIKISNNNVNPINFYINIKGNRVFIFKYYDQLKQNKFIFNPSNYCFKS